MYFERGICKEAYAYIYIHCLLICLFVRSFVCLLVYLFLHYHPFIYLSIYLLFSFSILQAKNTRGGERRKHHSSQGEISNVFLKLG